MYQNIKFDAESQWMTIIQLNEVVHDLGYNEWLLA